MTNFNDAITRHLRSPSIGDDGVKRRLIGELGEDGWKRLEEIFEFACRQADLWVRLSDVEAWAEVQSRLRQEFPELTEEAAKKIANEAAYVWR